jgi:hypothetical protein
MVRVVLLGVADTPGRRFGAPMGGAAERPQGAPAHGRFDSSAPADTAPSLHLTRSDAAGRVRTGDSRWACKVRDRVLVLSSCACPVCATSAGYGAVGVSARAASILRSRRFRKRQVTPMSDLSRGLVLWVLAGRGVCPSRAVRRIRVLTSSLRSGVTCWSRCRGGGSRRWHRRSRACWC